MGMSIFNASSIIFIKNSLPTEVLWEKAQEYVTANLLPLGKAKLAHDADD